MRDVSRRVIERAGADDKYVKDLETVSATSGSPNIELLISLVEQSKIDGWEYKTQTLKDLVRRDIESILTRPRTDRFYLHKALFELHRHRSVLPQERVTGLISLNYDDVLDRAYGEYYGNPNYCFSLEGNAPAQKALPLLKLHGSFNWRKQEIRGRFRRIEIIPLGANKNYLHAPYAFIWNRALETLIECDTLRVIGCSLSQNDAHLIDLLFKAHLERRDAFDMEIIGSPRLGEQIRNNYGFFPKIKTLAEIQGPMIAEPDSKNPFKVWLKYKIDGMIKGGKNHTKYLKAAIK